MPPKLGGGASLEPSLTQRHASWGHCAKPRKKHPTETFLTEASPRSGWPLDKLAAPCRKVRRGLRTGLCAAEHPRLGRVDGWLRFSSASWFPVCMIASLFIQVEEKRGKTEEEEKNILKHCGDTHSYTPAFINSTYCVAWHCGHMDE